MSYSAICWKYSTVILYGFVGIISLPVLCSISSNHSNISANILFQCFLVIFGPKTSFVHRKIDCEYHKNMFRHFRDWFHHRECNQYSNVSPIVSILFSYFSMNVSYHFNEFFILFHTFFHCTQIKCFPTDFRP